MAHYLSYDDDNRLTHAFGEGPNGWYDARYYYDALGRRTKKRVAYGEDIRNQTIIVTEFIWQGLRLLQEKTDNQRRTYLYDPNEHYSPLARINQSLDSQENKTQSVDYFHTDINGAALDLTANDGDIIWCGKYQAWGKLKPPIRINLDQLQHSEQPLRFAGQYADDETGLYYNTFRYYNPETGRFTTQDPIGLAGGLNLYQYAPNVFGWLDPLGLSGNDILQNSLFWKNYSDFFKRTNIRVKGAPVYEVTKKIDVIEIKKGDYFHLDTLHKNEIEVYDSLKNHKRVHDLSGNKVGGVKKGRKCG